MGYKDKQMDLRDVKGIQLLGFSDLLGGRMDFRIIFIFLVLVIEIGNIGRGEFVLGWWMIIDLDMWNQGYLWISGNVQEVVVDIVQRVRERFYLGVIGIQKELKIMFVNEIMERVQNKKIRKLRIKFQKILIVKRQVKWLIGKKYKRVIVLKVLMIFLFQK